MNTIYDRKGKFAGYLKGKSIYDRHHSFVGYIQDSMLLDAFSRPVAFAANNSIYTMAGTPWAYFDGHVLRDIQGNRLGRVKGDWQGLLSAGLILGEGISWQQSNYRNNPEGNYSQGGGLFSGLGSIGNTLRNFLGGGFGTGYGGAYHSGTINNPYRKYGQQNYRGGWQRSEGRIKVPNRGETNYSGGNSSGRYDYNRGNYPSGWGNNNTGYYGNNSSGINWSGLGRMVINNIGPISSFVGRYVLGGGGLGNLGSLANLAGIAGLGGLNNAGSTGNSVNTAGLGNLGNLNLQNIAPLASALASMLGGMNAGGQGAGKA